jgi:hypothetical protein
MFSKFIFQTTEEMYNDASTVKDQFSAVEDMMVMTANDLAPGYPKDQNACKVRTIRKYIDFFTVGGPIVCPVGDLDSTQWSRTQFEFHLSPGMNFTAAWNSTLNFRVTIQNMGPSQFGVASSGYDFIEAVTLRDRHGTVIERRTDVATLCASMTPMRHTTDWLQNGQGLGAHFAPNNIGTGGRSDGNFDPRTRPMYATAFDRVAVMNFALPLTELLGIFTSDTLLPPALLEGARLTVDLAVATDALCFTMAQTSTADVNRYFIQTSGGIALDTSVAVLDNVELRMEERLLDSGLSASLTAKPYSIPFNMWTRVQNLPADLSTYPEGQSFGTRRGRQRMLMQGDITYSCMDGRTLFFKVIPEVTFRSKKKDILKKLSLDIHTGMVFLPDQHSINNINPRFNLPSIEQVANLSQIGGHGFPPEYSLQPHPIETLTVKTSGNQCIPHRPTESDTELRSLTQMVGSENPGSTSFKQFERQGYACVDLTRAPGGCGGQEVSTEYPLVYSIMLRDMNRYAAEQPTKLGYCLSNENFGYLAGDNSNDNVVMAFDQSRRLLVCLEHGAVLTVTAESNLVVY